MGRQRYLPSRRPDCWTGSLEATWNETGDVDTTSTDRRTRPGRFTIDSPPTSKTGDVDTVPINGRTGQDQDLRTSSTRPLTPEITVVTPEVDNQIRRPPTESCQGYRPAAPIQRFNNKSLDGVKTKGRYIWCLIWTRLP